MPLIFHYAISPPLLLRPFRFDYFRQRAERRAILIITPLFSFFHYFSF
jgi:hypothetical protein